MRGLHRSHHKLHWRQVMVSVACKTLGLSGACAVVNVVRAELDALIVLGPCLCRAVRQAKPHKGSFFDNFADIVIHALNALARTIVRVSFGTASAFNHPDLRG